MIIGFNIDIQINDKVYHVQTEDLGRNNPHILTLLYQSGHIIYSKKTNYAQILKAGPTDSQIQQLMQQQHQQIVEDLQAGKFTQAKPEEKPKVREFAADLLASDKSFDQVILDFLSSQEKDKK